MYYGKETDELKKQEKSMKVFLVMTQMEKQNQSLMNKTNIQQFYYSAQKKRKICLMYLENKEKTILIQETMEWMILLLMTGCQKNKKLKGLYNPYLSRNERGFCNYLMKNN